MNDTPAGRSPFWTFSLKFYAAPGVAPACLALQDEAGVDVNVLLFFLWQATQKRTYDEADAAEIERLAGGWREMAVVPLRAVRRALKSPPPLVPAETAEGFRTRIKSAELEAERLQQEAMFALAQSGRFGRPAASADEAARGSVSAYQRVLRPFPPGPLDTILAAFAKFEAPV